MFLRQSLLVLGLLVGGYLPATAQQRTVSGNVKDYNGEAVPGVTVMVKGTQNGTITDIDGNYNIGVDSGSSLVFSFIGLKSQTIVVGEQSTINVTMENDAIGLEEVVAVGYGTRKKESLTGSISTIKSDEMREAPVANVSNSLAGRLPGLVAVTSSGEPGTDGSTLRIRGSNTFNDNSVLIIVDGVPGRSLDRIDPNSIESISVLKDASAAIYGAQAANGVILVTTKRGKIGKPEISYKGEFGFNQPTKLPEMADAPTYASMLNEIAYYENNDNGFNSIYTEEQIQLFRDGSDPLRYPNIDWFDEVIKPQSAQNSHNISINGGTEKMKYFVSLGTRFQDGNYKNSSNSYRQHDFRSNIDGEITKDISVGVDISGRLENRNYPISSAYDIFRGIIQSYPTSVARWPNGEPGPALEGGRNPVVTSTDVPGYNRQKKYVFNSNLKLDVNIPWVKGLSFSGNASFDQSFNFFKIWKQPYELYTWDGNSVDENGDPILQSKTYGGGTNNAPSLKEEFRSDYQNLYYGIFNYETVISNDHNLKMMVGAQVDEGNMNRFDVYRDLYLSTAIQEIFAGQTANQRTGGSGSVNARQSYFGRINYDFANKYLFEFVGRYDGSYIFPEDNRFGFFPGVSLGWVASEERFWKDNLSFIDYFKLRASIGQTGNDRVGEFQYLTKYLLGYQTNPGWNMPFVTYSGSDLTELNTLYESVLANPNITWEVANQANIGINASLLNGKLSIEADYFEYRRSNILGAQNANVPNSAGLSLPDVNYGKASNKGFDFLVSYNDYSIGDFGYSISFNGSYSKSKVEEWDETEGIPEWQKKTGHPMGSGLYYKTDGIYNDQAEIDAHDVSYEIGTTPEPGDVKFVDYDDNGIINADDRVRIYKNNIPSFTFGSNINLKYKNIDLSMLLQGATGGVAYITSEAGQFGNYLQSFADERWTADNPNASGPRTFNRGNLYWTNNSNTYWLHKTDYLRLKTLQIGYTLPKSFVDKIGLENVRVYASGYNLLTFSPDMKDFDPEVGSNTGATSSAASVNGYNYPLNRVVSMGVNIVF
ncbi:TonB-dependent receptor [Labilibacter sediminis]|nr:TonB-dependent receptor [Labilibacter sediminis]